MAYDNFYNSVGLLLHGEGANGSTTITDHGPLNLTTSIVCAGNAQISTADSKFGSSCILLDGTGDYFYIPDGLIPEIGSQDFSIELQFKLTATGTTQVLLCKDYTGSAFPPVLLIVTAAAKLRMAFSGNGSSYFLDVTGLTTITTGVWHQLLLTRSGSAFNAYLDAGASPEITGSNASAIYNNTNRWTFGASDYGTPTNFLNGKLDEVRITIGAVRPNVAQTEAFPGFGYDIYYNNTSLILHCNGTNGSTSFPDNSYNPKTVTAVGNAQVTTTPSNKWGGACLTLDGTGDYLSIPTSPDFDFGSGDLTLEGLFRLDNTTGNKAVMGRWVTAPELWEVEVQGSTKLKIAWYSAGSNYNTIEWTCSLLALTWYYWCIRRIGTAWEACIDFTTLTPSLTSITNQTILSGSNALTIGAFGGGVGPFAGQMHDIRVTKGVGRTPFAVPVEAFPNSAAPGNPGTRLILNASPDAPAVSGNRAVSGYVPIHHLNL